LCETKKEENIGGIGTSCGHLHRRMAFPSFPCSKSENHETMSLANEKYMWRKGRALR
jgi:hypothetical protein